MHRIFAACIFSLASIIPSCQTTPRNVVVAPTGPAQQKREDAAKVTTETQAALDTENQARLSKGAASFNAISSVTESPATVKEDAAHQEALNGLAAIGLEPTDKDKAVALERVNLIVTGQKDAAEKAYADAKSESEQRLVALSSLQEQLASAKLAESKAQAAAQLERDSAAQKLQAAVDEMRKSYETKLQAARDAERAKQVKYLNLGGVAALLIFGLAVGFGGLAGLKVGWIFGLLSVVCFGLAQIVAQWWFMWAILIACGGVIIAMCAWAYIHYRQGNLKAAAEQKASAFETFAQDVVPTLDSAYDAADAATKQVLDDTIFSKLSAMMDKSTKSLVHLVRATPTITAPTPAPTK